MKELVNSLVNILTYMALGIMLLVFGISMYHIASPYEMLIFFGIFIGLLIFAVVIGYTGNRAFPNFEMERYRIFFFFIELIVVVLLLSLGIALRIESANVNGIISDSWSYYDIGKLLALGGPDSLPDITVILFLVSPEKFVYSLLCSFAIWCNGDSAFSVLYLQIILNVLLSFFAYRVSRKVSGRLSGIVTLTILLLMPSLVASIGFLYEALPGLLLLMLQLWVFFSLQKRKNKTIKRWIKIVCYSFDGLLMALTIFSIPETIFVLIGEIIYASFLKTHLKEHVLSTITLTISSISGFIGLLLVKAVYLGRTFEAVLSGFLSYYYTGGGTGQTGDLRFMALNLKNVYSIDNFADKYLLHNLPMENAILYGNLLLMAVVCLIFLWTQNERAYFILNLFFLSSFCYGAAFVHENIYHINILPYLAILSGVMFEKIYVAFKVEPKRISKMVKRIAELNIGNNLEKDVIDLNTSDIPDSVDKTEEKSDLIKSEEEIVTNQVNAEEIIDDEEEIPTVEKVTGVKPKEISRDKDLTKPLDNPLPIPSKKEKKESEKDLDFDIEVSETDDFDI